MPPLHRGLEDGVGGVMDGYIKCSEYSCRKPICHTYILVITRVKTYTLFQKIINLDLPAQYMQAVRLGFIFLLKSLLDQVALGNSHGDFFFIFLIIMTHNYFLVLLSQVIHQKMYASRISPSSFVFYSKI